jgi:N4-(beta-N-acetylglucosaminyl)-L-asparaginase
MIPIIVTSKVIPEVRDKIARAGWDELAAGGSPLDAAVRATNVSELDPEDVTVGYGGDPNEEGVPQLDAAVMSGPDGNIAGAVAGLEGIRTPSSVARLVMERTDHLLLVGAGALRFAKLHGFREEDILSDRGRLNWLRWKEAMPGSYYHTYGGRKPEGGGTIVVLAVDGSGGIAGASSTTGHRFKIPGRVGDTPIIGAGLYVDNDVGGAGATGHGEESIKVCASFLAVEKMREGLSPGEACTYVCRRVADRHYGNPMFNLKVIAVAKDGEVGCCSLRGTHDQGGRLVGLGVSIHDDDGYRLVPGEAVLPPMADEDLANLPLR